MTSALWVANRVFRRYYGPDKELNIAILRGELEKHAHTFENIIDTHEFFQKVYDSLGGAAYIEREFGYPVQFDVFDTSRSWAGLSTIVTLVFTFFYVTIMFFILIVQFFTSSNYQSDILLFGSYYDGFDVYTIWRIGRLGLISIVSLFLYGYHHKISIMARSIISVFTGLFTLFFGPFLVMYSFLQIPQKHTKKLITAIIIAGVIGFGLNQTITWYLRQNIIKYSVSEFNNLDYEFHSTTNFLIPFVDTDLEYGFSWVDPTTELQISMYYIEPSITITNPLLTIPDDLVEFDDNSTISYNILVNGIPLCNEDIEYEFQDGHVQGLTRYAAGGCKSSFDEHRTYLMDFDYHTIDVSILLTYRNKNQEQTIELLMAEIDDALMYAGDNVYHGYDILPTSEDTWDRPIERMDIRTYGDSVGMMELLVHIPGLNELALDIKNNTDIIFTYNVGGVLLDEQQISVLYNEDDEYFFDTNETITYYFPSTEAPSIDDFMTTIPVYIRIEYTNTEDQNVVEMRYVGTIEDFQQYEFLRR